MLRLPPTVRVYLCLEHADMRRGFDGLSRMTLDIIDQDPFSGHLFVFRNRRGDRVKILYWDHDGFAIWYKRLEKGTFLFPPSDNGECCISMGAVDLALILEGIDISRIRRQKRYKKTHPAQDIS